MDKGPLRTLLPNPNKTTSKVEPVNYTSAESGRSRDLFSSFLLGTPLTLTTNIPWPLDLFMTPPAISAYSDIHAYLMAIRVTHQRLLECWSSLSAAQRSRRGWTGATQGGTVEEAGAGKKLARSAWGTVRVMLFFLDQLQSHFMVDIIDVQHRRLVDQLDGLGSPPTASTLVSNSVRGSMRPPCDVGNGNPPGSPVPSSHHAADVQSTRSRAPPAPGKSVVTFLDFLTLRYVLSESDSVRIRKEALLALNISQLHARHLSFLSEGLLLADRVIAELIRDILDTCQRFTGLVERWGGDVVPELLTEDVRGVILEERGSKVESIVDVSTSFPAPWRNLILGESKELNDLLADLFRSLVETQNPRASAGDASSTNAGTSVCRTARATQMMQTSRVMSRHNSFVAKKTTSGKSKAEIVKEERAYEAEALMRRHIEQCE